MTIIVGKLTKHFSWTEATYSATAAKLGIKNEPSSQAATNIIKAAIEMEKVREILGNSPILINSWFRNPEVNRAVGGVANSDHLSGLAVDFRCPAVGDVTGVFQRLAKSDLEFDQLIWEYGKWVHISFAPAMRQETLYIENARIGYRLGLPT